MSLNLQSLLAPNKTVEVEYPGMPGFLINLQFLSRETILNIRKKSTKTTFKNRQATDEFNEDVFLELYCKSTVKGWTGLKLKYLDQLAPIDLGDNSPEDELEYTEENALSLMKASPDFDSFVTEQVGDLGNFSKNK